MALFGSVRQHSTSSHCVIRILPCLSADRARKKLLGSLASMMAAPTLSALFWHLLLSLGVLNRAMIATRYPRSVKRPGKSSTAPKWAVTRITPLFLRRYRSTVLRPLTRTLSRQ